MNVIDLVIKIGSMALIQRDDGAIDYNIFQRLGDDLRPGMALVTSGATEIGRIDYIRRTGGELHGDLEQDKADYAAQGQIILMDNYRRFVRPEFGVRQVLVEHTHFNDDAKRDHIRRLLLRAAQQGCIPIINYNDPVNDEENRKMELASRRLGGGPVVECVDNDETADSGEPANDRDKKSGEATAEPAPQTPAVSLKELARRTGGREQPEEKPGLTMAQLLLKKHEE